MSEQPDLFTALERRDEALHRALRNANDPWKSAAVAAIVRCSTIADTFTTDEVWAELHRSGYSTHEPRALGAVMKMVASDGLIEATPNWRQSIRPECHARPVRIWRRAV